MVREHCQSLNARRMIVDPAFKPVRIIVVFDCREIVLFPIKIWSKSPSHLDSIITKLHINLIQRCCVPLDGHINGNSSSQIVKNLLERFIAVLFDQVFDKHRCLEIRELQIFRLFRTQKRTTHFANRIDTSIKNSLAMFGTHSLAPRRRRLTFFVDRDPFAEPARHPVFGFLQRHNMAEFMP